MSIRRHAAPATAALAPGHGMVRASHEPGALATDDFGLINHSTHLPYWARNRAQRVLDRACVACGGPVLRARRGPAPRHCVPCEIGLRRTHQLRAYLRAAERLAESLDRSDVAAAARGAVARLDEGTPS